MDMTITNVVLKNLALISAAKEIYETTLRAMDAAEKEQQSGADKKAWVVSFVKNYFNQVRENWDDWENIILLFIDLAKTIFNKERNK